MTMRERQFVSESAPKKLSTMNELDVLNKYVVESNSSNIGCLVGKMAGSLNRAS